MFFKGTVLLAKDKWLFSVAHIRIKSVESWIMYNWCAVSLIINERLLKTCSGNKRIASSCSSEEEEKKNPVLFKV